MVVYQYTNVKRWIDDELVTDDIWVENGKFIDQMERFWSSTSDHEYFPDFKVDCKGLLASPGYIDIQFNGGFGIDFTDQNLSIESIQEVAHKLLQFGVTSFCPTVISSTAEQYHKILQVFNSYHEKQQCKTLTKPTAESLGLHLEGPFFSPYKLGAHNPTYICEPLKGATSFIEKYGDLTNVKLITLAPELTGSIEAIKEIKALYPDIVISIGHSSAKIKEAESAVVAGAQMITHLFNAMTAFHHRDPGIIGLLGLPKYHANLHYGIIADGVHCHPASICMALHSHKKGIVLVTDAMAALGLGVGKHVLGTMGVEVSYLNDNDKDLHAVIAGTDILAGSVVSLDTCVRNLLKFTDCSIAFALEAATSRPAKVVNVEKGSFRHGSDADFILLNEQLEVQATYVQGEQVWSKIDC